MKVLLLTNEYPPNIYGGAGVHIDNLSRELAQLMEVDVRSFGDQRIHRDWLSVRGFGLPETVELTAPKPLHSVFGAAQRSLDFNKVNIDAQIVHCHTWYTHLGGILAKLNYGIPLVVTVHSLEPLRPWKREQLQGGYDFSCWVERTALEMADAIVAVSSGTRADVLQHFNVRSDKVHIIYNGINLKEFNYQDPTPTLQHYNIDPQKPYVLFVGRITRQKGIIHLVHAIRYMEEGYQIVLCAGAPDTEEIAREMNAAVEEVSRERAGVFWINEMVGKEALIQLYSGAAVFCCPSIYEPFGIINLEAMACETPVVASDVGGIPEVVIHGETGYLVPLAQSREAPFAPLHPEDFARDLATQINRLMANPERRARFAKAGRLRAEQEFSWTSIAQQTRELYEKILSEK